MDLRQYLKNENPYFTEEHIDALLRFKRIVFPQLDGSAIVIGRSLHQETYQHPYVVMKWSGEVGARRGRKLNPFELLLLAEAVKRELKKDPPVDPN
jgi:hypothetical protein